MASPAWLPTSQPLVALAGRALLAVAPTAAIAVELLAMAAPSAASPARRSGRPCASWDSEWMVRLLCAAAAAASPVASSSAVRYPAAAWSPQAWALVQSLVGRAASAPSASGSDSSSIPERGQSLTAAFVPRASEDTVHSPRRWLVFPSANSPDLPRLAFPSSMKIASFVPPFTPGSPSKSYTSI